jgi:hypothetical protein
MNTDERRAREALLDAYDLLEDFEELYRDFPYKQGHKSQTPNGIVDEFLEYLANRKIAYRKKHP